MENELNKWIVEVLFEGCWHKWEGDWLGDGMVVCGCGEKYEWNDNYSADWRPPNNPEFTKSLDLASLAEAKAIEVVGREAYIAALAKAVSDQMTRHVMEQFPGREWRSIEIAGWLDEAKLHVPTAGATARCTAVRAAVEGK